VSWESLSDEEFAAKRRGDTENGEPTPAAAVGAEADCSPLSVDAESAELRDMLEPMRGIGSIPRPAFVANGDLWVEAIVLLR
jgi:hypothetical protein